MLLAVILTSLFLLLVNLPVVTLAQITNLSTDKAALLSFSKGLVSSGDKLVDWNDENVEVCKWFGVNCTRDRVARLSLPAIGLKGPIVANSIGKLDALKYLSLRSNSLYGTVPQDMLSIPTLQYIQLQHNNFCGDFPAFRKSKSLPLGLIIVDLSYNSFTGKIPDLLPMLRQLWVLRLENNSFSGHVPDFISCTLTVLNLTYNTLDGEIPYSLHNFSNYSFIGNQRLCGEPLINCSELAPAPAPLSNIAPPCSEKVGAFTFVASMIIMFLLV